MKSDLEIQIQNEEKIIKDFRNGTIDFPWIRERIENPR